MKKITFFLGVLSLLTISFQANAQSRDIDKILTEYNSLKNIPLPEMMVINQNFNEEDKAVLLDYFEQQRASHKNLYATNKSFVPSEFFVLNVRNGFNFGTISGTAPFETINLIQSPYPILCVADDFARDGDYYGLEFLNDANDNPVSRTIVKINSEDGSFITIGDIGPATSYAIPTGLAFDFTTDTMYLTAGEILYTVDLTNGDLTEVGPMGTNITVWLVIDNNGNAYTADIITDQLYSVDLSTGDTSVIGPLNIEISFAQEATIDPVDNTLYMAAYVLAGIGGVYTVDVTTGETTLVGDTTPLNAQFGMFSVQGEPESLGFEDSVLSSFDLYPNPSNTGVIELRTPSSSPISVIVFDALGKNVFDAVVSDSSLNVSSLKSGLYIVQVIQDGQTAQKKLIIE